MYKENSDKSNPWQYETGWRLLQRLFDFEQHIDDIPRVFTSSREQTFGASIFRDPIYHLIKSQSITIKFNQPQYISKLSFQTAIYIQFQSWQILHQSVRKVWNLLCAILWSITTGHHGFYLRWHIMAKVNDNHIQPKSNETPLPPRRRSCFA